MSFTSYISDQAACNSVFIATIAAAADVSTSSVLDLIVSDSATATATAALASLHLRAADKGTSSDAVSLQYTIQVPSSSGVTYSQLSSALASSVQSGQFTTQMQGFATAQGVPELSSASSSSIETQDTSTPAGQDKDSNGLSAGAVAGIVIGVLAAVLLCGFVVFRMYVQRVPDRSGFQDLNKPRGEGLFSAPWVSSPMHQQGEL